MANRKNFPHRVLKRREEAKVRQEASDKRPVHQRLEKAVPGSKEYAKLLLKVQK